MEYPPFSLFKLVFILRNLKMDLSEIGLDGMDWIDMAQDMD
jgi:hypothetical protein